MGFQITGVSIVCWSFVPAQIQENIKSPRHWTLCDRWPVDSPREGPVTPKMFPFDDVIMEIYAPKISRIRLFLILIITCKNFFKI